MDVVHIESGLGNQMLSYCEYIALKKMHPNKDIYLETIIYDIKDAGNVFCQWNGYELKRIFGINTPCLNEYFSKSEWEEIVSEVKDSRFWEKNWNYPIYITKALNNHGLHLLNLRGDFEKNKKIDVNSFLYKLKQTGIYENVRRIYFKIVYKKKFKNDIKNLYFSGDNDVFTGHRLTFRFRNNNIEIIESEIREKFKFPDFKNEKNINLALKLKSEESVAIHARRGDMLSINGKFYKNGYFKRAVRLIKKNIKNPVFYFFCDPGSINWCKENQRIFGLDFKKDNIHFVDWNKGTESYRDMQLMSYCKHNIITNSSFGWWGAFLNTNPNKITISPEINTNTTHHC